MAEPRTEEHSRLGIASFVLFLGSGELYGLFLPMVILSSYLAPPEASGDVAVLWVRMVTLFQQVALVVGIAGALQRRRKRVLAFLGITCSGLLLVPDYVIRGPESVTLRGIGAKRTS